MLCVSLHIDNLTFIAHAQKRYPDSLHRAITPELGIFGHTAPSHGWDQQFKLNQRDVQVCVRERISFHRGSAPAPFQ